MAYHGDDVCGGSCIGAQQNSCTIPTVENLQGRIFSFPPKPLFMGKAVRCTAFQ
jgi:hypothetical protein